MGTRCSLCTYQSVCPPPFDSNLTFVFCSLNSRKFNVITRGIEAIEGEAVGMNQIIARANRLAKQERWNVPEVRPRPRYLVRVRTLFRRWSLTLFPHLPPIVSSIFRYPLGP